MRWKAGFSLSLVLAAMTAWAQDDAVVVTEVGYLPENVATGSVNLSTDISGDSFAALASRTTDQVLDRLVNITFVNADLENALRIIARQMDLNIIIGPGVRGKTITLDLRDVPLRFALDAILRANDLGFVVERGGIVRVVEQSEIQPDEYQTQMLVRRLNWQIASDLEPILEEFLSDEGEVRADVATNAIIVNDVPSRIDEIDALLQELDTPERQVQIESRLVDISETGQRSLRANFGIGQVDTQTSNIYPDTGGNAPFNQLFDPLVDPLLENPFVPSDSLGVSTPTLGTSANGVYTAGMTWGSVDVALKLEALENEGLARVLASPRVTTINNVPAEIEIVREAPYVESTFNPGGQTTQEVNFSRTVGVTLGVTPRITNNGYVRMNIQTNQDIQVGQVSIPGSPSVPVIATRQAESNVITPDRGTAVIGGLRQLEDVNNVDGVPWFKDLPAFGWLFRGTDNDRARTDYYAFISPTVIQDVDMNATDRYAYDLLDLEWNVPTEYWLDDSSIETTY